MAIRKMIWPSDKTFEYDAKNPTRENGIKTNIYPKENLEQLRNNRNGEDMEMY